MESDYWTQGWANAIQLEVTWSDNREFAFGWANIGKVRAKDSDNCCVHSGQIEFVEIVDGFDNDVLYIEGLDDNGVVYLSGPNEIGFDWDNKGVWFVEHQYFCPAGDKQEEWVNDERIDKRLHLWMEFGSESEYQFDNTCSFNFKAYFEDYPIPSSDQVETEGGFVCFSHWEPDCKSRNCLKKGDIGFVVRGKTQDPRSWDLSAYP